MIISELFLYKGEVEGQTSIAQRSLTLEMRWYESYLTKMEIKFWKIIII